MNILGPIGPVIITLDPSGWGQTIILPATIKPGYDGKVAKFKFNITLVTENPADMGGMAGLQTEDTLLA